MLSKELVRITKPDTGETLDGCLIWTSNRAKIKEHYVMLFQTGFEHLGTNNALTRTDWRVLAQLFARLDFENYIHITQAEIARRSKIAKQHVSTSFKNLIDQGIVIKGPRVGKVYTYRLSDTYGWKGSAEKLKKHREQKIIDLARHRKSKETA